MSVVVKKQSASKGTEGDLVITCPDNVAIIEPCERNRKTPVPQWLMGLVIVLTIAVIVTTVSLIVVLVQSYSRWSNDAEDRHKLGHYKTATLSGDVFTFDDVFSADYRPKGYSASWLEGTNSQIYRDDNGDVVKHDRDTNNVEILVPNAVMVREAAFSYFVNADSTQVLLAFDYLKVWRHSFQAQYKIYDVATGATTDFPNFTGIGTNRLQYANWASQGDALVFVYGNNLFYQGSPSMTAEAISSNGDPLFRFNGIPDWLYEEDVLGSREAVYWSQDAQYLVYGEFDDRTVPLVQYPLYGSESEAYSTLYQAAYPKPGDVRNNGQIAGPNSEARLYVVNTNDLASGTIELQPPISLRLQDHYFTRVSWTDSNKVMVTWTNRVQNQAVVHVYDVIGNGYENYELEVNGGWIDSPWPRPVMMDSDTEYLTLLSQVQGADSWKHMAKVTQPSSGSPGTVEFITEGQMEVLSILAYDSTRHVAYYYTTNGDPRDRHLFRIGLEGASSEDSAATCMSCDIEQCEYVTVSFSDTLEYYTLGCLGPDVPSYRLRKTDGSAQDVMLEDNAEFRARIDAKAIATRQFVEVPVGGDYMAQGEIFYPPGYVTGDSHPLLVDTYAGPGSQAITKRFPMGGSSSNWAHHLASEYGVITVSVDGRGASGRGDNYRFEMYRGMGTVEVDDQVAAATYFRDQGYIDDTMRSAIWGWSYGGMAASLALGRSSQELQCGMAVAPVTNMRLYDTAYTERYMGLATNGDNAAGYNNTDVMLLVENFRDKQFLLAHGTHDDNVHYRNTALLNDKLIDAEIQFKLLNYPDQDHGIGDDGRHLFRALTDFLIEDCYDTSSADLLRGSAALLLIAALHLLLRL